MSKADARPADFPNGYKRRNGMFYKTDKDGNVIDIRNLYGCDISEFADIRLAFGCKPKSARVPKCSVD